MPQPGDGVVVTPSLQPRVQVRDTVCSTLSFGLSSVERVSEAAYFRIQPLSTNHPLTSCPHSPQLSMPVGSARTWELPAD